MVTLVNPFIDDDKLSQSLYKEIFQDDRFGGTFIKVPRGEALFWAGEQDDNIYYVKKGLFKLVMTTEEGNEKVLFFHGKGTLVGFHGLRKEKLPLSNAIALIDSEVYAVKSDLFFEYLKAHPDIFYSFTKYIFQILQIQAYDSVNISFYTAEQRLAAFLVVLAGEIGVIEGEILLSYTNDELADVLGFHRNSITNAIASLAKRGYVQKVRNGIIILDLKKLKDFVNKER